ncbi:hypothetical protein J2Z75_005277 [Rhizobium herbae]|uniref:Uncharacterized protein n=1 Tax=Rhizobium herbae TaxID=508661 RepID=A0ABS4EUW8_9HYPH|nr:hypothetical protein [Rhizobium herbae]
MSESAFGFLLAAEISALIWAAVFVVAFSAS